MSNIGPILKRTVWVTYLVLLHVIAAFFIWRTVFPSGISSLWSKSEAVSGPIVVTDAPTPPPVPTLLSGQDNAAVNFPAVNSNASAPQVSPSGLIIPVRGIRPEQLVDSFADARSEGRVHDAIDIPAPAGTPVLAAAAGTIVKFHDSAMGGITIYQLSEDQRFVYYYAHLQRRDESIYEKKTVKQGEVIGYVGDTGNAGAGNYHLHFAVSSITDPGNFWHGTSIDPFPLLGGRPPSK